MVIIYDNDLPITAAERLITATRPIKMPLLQKITQAVPEGGKPKEETLVDMYDLDDLEEIARYIMIYVNRYKDETK